ncbi:MAG: hypothetical protein LRY73_02670 [Bacillus sp. (in: Bacteria)]|nr:hypothetical protein [Bacillus sp. (in: firmicutes)]
MNRFNRIFFSVVIVHFLYTIYLFETAFEMELLGAIVYFVIGGYLLIAVGLIGNGYYLYKNKWKVNLSPFRWFDYVLILLPIAGLIYILTY